MAREPNRKPVNSAMVAWWKRCRSQYNKREKHSKPAPQPRMNTSRKTRSSDFTAASTVLYMPSRTRIKLPEMPGRIMAHMARNPARKTPARPKSRLATGEKAISPATSTPTSRQAARDSVQPSTCRSRTTAEAKIRPKKNAQSGTGWFSRTQEMSRASDKILVPMPSNSADRKPPLTCAQAPRIFPRTSNDRKVRSNARILARRVS